MYFSGHGGVTPDDLEMLRGVLSQFSAELPPLHPTEMEVLASHLVALFNSGIDDPDKLLKQLRATKSKQ